jgi:hypothetical protein
MDDIPEDMLAISVPHLVLLLLYIPQYYLIPNYKEQTSNSYMQLQHEDSPRRPR